MIGCLTMSVCPLVVVAMGGIGDSIYQRPFVRALAAEHGEVWLSTPWPELFRDIGGLRFVKPERMGLRTQQKNIERQAGIWVDPPANAMTLVLRYKLKEPKRTILQELEGQVPLDAGLLRFDLPDFGPPPVELGRPYAVVRPVTSRREWLNPARNPRPEYVTEAARLLRAEGYAVVCVADVDGKNEWLDLPLPIADRYLLRGELGPAELMALVQHASVAVGGVGWIVPAALAAGTPLICIGGGQGGYNAPEILTDPRLDLSRARFLLPEHYCRCTERFHDCPKEISEFELQFRVVLGVVTAEELMVA